jgi:hypothetical protein
LLLLALLFGVAGCKDQSAPARQAILDIETIVEKVGADAQQNVPNDYNTVVNQLANLKARFNQKDYQGVLAQAPAVMSEARALAQANDRAIQQAAQQQQADRRDLESDWDTLRNDVPKSITTLDARVTELSKTKSLPAGVTNGALDSARGNLDDAKSLWQQAAGNHAAGSVQDAVAAGQQAKEKADAAMVDLGMTSTG